MSLFQRKAPKCIEVDRLQKMVPHHKQNSERHGIQDSSNNKQNFYQHVCKSNQEVGYSKTIHQGFWQLTLLKRKTQVQDFVLPVPRKKNLSMENLLVTLRKSGKVWPTWIYQNSFKKGLSKATLSFLLLLRSRELLTRCTELNSFLSKSKRYTVKMLLKPGKCIPPKEN